MGRPRIRAVWYMVANVPPRHGEASPGLSMSPRSTAHQHWYASSRATATAAPATATGGEAEAIPAPRSWHEVLTTARWPLTPATREILVTAWRQGQEDQAGDALPQARSASTPGPEPSPPVRPVAVALLASSSSPQGLARGLGDLLIELEPASRAWDASEAAVLWRARVAYTRSEDLGGWLLQHPDWLPVALRAAPFPGHARTLRHLLAQGRWRAGSMRLLAQIGADVIRALSPEPDEHDHEPPPGAHAAARAPWDAPVQGRTRGRTTLGPGGGRGAAALDAGGARGPCP